MGYFCCCCERKYKKGSGYAFFSFPKNDVLRKKWLKACGYPLDPRDELSKMRVCSEHFKKSSFRITRENGPLYLKPDAVPIKFTTKSKAVQKSIIEEPPLAPSSPINVTVNRCIKKELSPTVNTPTGIAQPNSEINVPSENIHSQNNISIDNSATPKKRTIWGPRHIKDLLPHHFNSPTKVERNLQIIKNEIQKKDMRIKQLTQSTYRMRKKIEYLHQLIKICCSSSSITPSTMSPSLISKDLQIKRKRRTLVHLQSEADKKNQDSEKSDENMVKSVVTDEQRDIQNREIIIIRCEVKQESEEKDNSEVAEAIS